MMDWEEKVRCLLCDQGGKLLVCNDKGCPISVHMDCMGCKAYFDDIGNFYCPYCVYKRSNAEACNLRDNAILAKKALSSFLGEREQTGNDIRDQSVHLEKHQCPKSPIPCEGTTHETSESEETDRLPKRHGEEVSEIYNGNTCRIMVVYEGHSKPTDAHRVDFVLRKEQRMNTDELESGDCKRVRVKDRARSAKCKDSGVAEIHEKGPLSNKHVISSSIETQSTRCNAIAPLLLGKRRVRWSDEEEDMLKEGVQKFSSKVQKKFPWKKVFEFGRHVFDASRTPGDLKDKWRNMSKLRHRA